MELTFPFKNLAFNNLIKLFEVGNIREYFEAEDKEEWMEESFNVRFYKDRIPSFENEILQIIETTNQETIDYYFNDLGENVERRAGSNLSAGRSSLGHKTALLRWFFYTCNSILKQYFKKLIHHA